MAPIKTRGIGPAGDVGQAKLKIFGRYRKCCAFTGISLSKLFHVLSVIPW